MKVSREQAEKNRTRVVEVAGAQFREHGFDGIGIADLMQAAGLTHGGFYGNFASKDDLTAEASAAAIAQTTATVNDRLAGAADPLAAYVGFYLSPEHRDNLGGGCVLAALAPDAARSTDALRQTFEQGVEAYLGLLTPLSRGDTDAERRNAAMAILATAVGALILSRTVIDPALSADLLAAASRHILVQK